MKPRLTQIIAVTHHRARFYTLPTRAFLPLAKQLQMARKIRSHSMQFNVETAFKFDTHMLTSYSSPLAQLRQLSFEAQFVRIVD